MEADVRKVWRVQFGFEVVGTDSEDTMKMRCLPADFTQTERSTSSAYSKYMKILLSLYTVCALMHVL